MIGKRTFKLELSEEDMSNLLAVLYWASDRVHYSDTQPQPEKLKLKAYEFWSILASICDGEGELK
jgi:hypothetical protein